MKRKRIAEVEALWDTLKAFRIGEGGRVGVSWLFKIEIQKPRTRISFCVSPKKKREKKEREESDSEGLQHRD
jgi:hypothetical protein